MGDPHVRDWLKLDRAPSSQLRIHGWEKESAEPYAATASTHDAVEIALVCQGTVRYAMRGRDVLATEGQVVVVPRGVEHATSFLTPVRALALWLGADFVAEIADTMGPATSALAAGTMAGKTKRVSTLLEILVDEVVGDAAGSTRAAEALTESIVIEVLRNAPRDESSICARDPRVVAAIAQMHACFAEPLGIEDLARTARMSRFHFSRLFRDETGQAPYQYLLRVRLASAATLLRGGHHSVTEAALASGFSDLSRFASMFRKHTGRRPSDMLRQARSA
jgi:AraC-like DNA-binding protein